MSQQSTHLYQSCVGLERYNLAHISAEHLTDLQIQYAIGICEIPTVGLVWPNYGFKSVEKIS